MLVRADFTLLNKAMETTQARSAMAVWKALCTIYSANDPREHSLYNSRRDYVAIAHEFCRLEEIALTADDTLFSRILNSYFVTQTLAANNPFAKMLCAFLTCYPGYMIGLTTNITAELHIEPYSPPYNVTDDEIQYLVDHIKYDFIRIVDAVPYFTSRFSDAQLGSILEAITLRFEEGVGSLHFFIRNKVKEIYNQLCDQKPDAVSTIVIPDLLKKITNQHEATLQQSGISLLQELYISDEKNITEISNAFVQLLNNPVTESSVKVRILNAFSNCNIFQSERVKSEVITTLLANLTAEDASVKTAAISALTRFLLEDPNKKIVIAAMLENLNHTDGSVKVEALTALKKLTLLPEEEKAIIPHVVARLLDEHLNTFFAAKEFLEKIIPGLINTKTLIPLLINNLNHEKALIRNTCIRLLATISLPQNDDTVINTLRNQLNIPATKESALVALGEISLRGKKTQPVLGLSDLAEGLQQTKSVQEKISMLGEVEKFLSRNDDPLLIIPELLQIFKGTDHHSVKEAALKAFAKVSPAAEIDVDSILLTIIPLLFDKNSFLRSQVINVLDRLALKHENFLTIQDAWLKKLEANEMTVIEFAITMPNKTYLPLNFYREAITRVLAWLNSQTLGEKGLAIQLLGQIPLQFNENFSERVNTLIIILEDESEKARYKPIAATALGNLFVEMNPPPAVINALLSFLNNAHHSHKDTALDALAKMALPIVELPRITNAIAAVLRSQMGDIGLKPALHIFITSLPHLKDTTAIVNSLKACLTIYPPHHNEINLHQVKNVIQTLLEFSLLKQDYTWVQGNPWVYRIAIDEIKFFAIHRLNNAEKNYFVYGILFNQLSTTTDKTMRISLMELMTSVCHKNAIDAKIEEELTNHIDTAALKQIVKGFAM